MRITVRVKPGYTRTSVGGHHRGELVVRVRERAVDGAATAAALKAVAEALGLRSYEVSLVGGTTGRSKVLEVPDGIEERVAALLE
ncbi:MAG TPA: DUF167 domain-containing protein [Mycobacteriales bacterium]|nr:DUF167 domain-containing protein [Mycobacteriales bacterium]